MVRARLHLTMAAAMAVASGTTALAGPAGRPAAAAPASTAAVTAGAVAGDPAALVDVTTVIPDVVLDLRYATAANLTGAALYRVARCKLRRAVAVRLARAAAVLRAEGRRLLLWDCYRPRSVQAALWRRLPDPRYVADPRRGSRHNRGAAVDLGLARRDGTPVALPTDFDAMGPAAHRVRALRGPAGQEARRLDRAMTAAGFVGLATEWWHYDSPDATRYRSSDEPL